MHRLLMEELYERGPFDFPRLGNFLGAGDVLLEAETKGKMPVCDLARRYYSDRNPFLSELACTLPAKMVVVPALAKVDYGFTGFISGRAILEHSLRASVSEVLLDSGRLGRLIQLEDGNWLVLFQRDLRGENPGLLLDGGEFDWDELDRRCAELKKRFRELWRCGLGFSVGKPIACEDLACEYEVLCAMEAGERIAPPRSRIAQRDDGLEEEGQADFRVWESMLRSGEGSALVKELTRCLVPRGRPPRGDFISLRRFQQDFLQVAYSALKAKGIRAHDLYDEDEEAALWDRSCRSVDGMITWASFVALRSVALIEAASHGSSVVDRVRRIVAESLDEDLSRKSLAGRVYLNPDYLARLFKKETGLSLCEYVLGERMACAKDLLSKTDMPVSSIALQVGYGNFSHFSEAFRKLTGLCPAEYRKAGPIGRAGAAGGRRGRGSVAR